MTLIPYYPSLSHWPEEEKEKDKGQKRKWRKATEHSHVLPRFPGIYEVPCELQDKGRRRKDLLVLSFLHFSPLGISSLLPKQPCCSLYFRLQTPRVPIPLSDDMEDAKPPIIQDSKNYLLVIHHHQVIIKQKLIHLKHLKTYIFIKATQKSFSNSEF